MRCNATTVDFIDYRTETDGCLNLKKLHYTLRDKDTGHFLLEGVIYPTDEARQMVLGTHPSGNWNSSVVGAALDLNDRSIKSTLLQDITKQELENVPMQQVSSGDPDAQGRRVKAITWAVVAIDREEDTVWVEGVI